MDCQGDADVQTVAVGNIFSPFFLVVVFLPLLSLHLEKGAASEGHAEGDWSDERAAERVFGPITKTSGLWHDDLFI